MSRFYELYLELLPSFVLQRLVERADLKMPKFLTILSTLIFLSGCVTWGSTMRYNGSGSYTDLVNARYNCSRQHNPCSSGFESCVKARGFYRSKNGRLDASNIRVACGETAARPVINAKRAAAPVSVAAG